MVLVVVTYVPYSSDYPREGHSNVKTARKATGNHLGYFPKT